MTGDTGTVALRPAVRDGRALSVLTVFPKSQHYSQASEKNDVPPHERCKDPPQKGDPKAWYPAPGTRHHRAIPEGKRGNSKKVHQSNRPRSGFRSGAYPPPGTGLTAGPRNGGAAVRLATTPRPVLLARRPVRGLKGREMVGQTNVGQRNGRIGGPGPT
jgi:hypothetical protein